MNRNTLIINNNNSEYRFTIYEKPSNEILFKANLIKKIINGIPFKVNYDNQFEVNYDNLFEVNYDNLFEVNYDNLFEVNYDNLFELEKSVATKDINDINIDYNNELAIYLLQNNNYEKLNRVTLIENKEKLKLIKKLKNNWNSYGASPIENSICIYTEKLINKLIVQPKIFPTSNNSIQLEYYDRKNLDNYLIFDINIDKINIFNSMKNQNLTFNDLNDKNIDKINSIIKVFYGIN